MERILTIAVQDACNSYNVANIFTPNGDGVNDVFQVNVEDISTYSILIYNRWDREIYASTNPAQPWDGKTKGGVDAPAGVYYYVIQSTCEDGRSTGKTGFCAVDTVRIIWIQYKPCKLLYSKGMAYV